MNQVRRSILQIMASGIAVGVPSLAIATPREVIDKILDEARQTLGGTDWAPKTPWYSHREQNFCNVYVAYVLQQAGAASWKPIKRDGDLLGRYTDPLAEEWMNPRFPLLGWRIIFGGPTDPRKLSGEEIIALRQPGDVVAGLGHVAIRGESDYPPMYYSASSKTGKVELNDWSEKPLKKLVFGPGEYSTALRNDRKKFTVRRFVGT